MFPSFLPTALLFQDPIQNTPLHLVITCSYVLLGSKFISLPLFLMAWTVVSTSQAFCRTSFCQSLSEVFLLIGLELRVSGKKTSGVKCHSHHIISRAHTINMRYHC